MPVTISWLTSLESFKSFKNAYTKKKCYAAILGGTANMF